MTSKLYYTDPLIAAYMYEYFDVHYIDEFKLEFIWGKSTTGLYPVAPEKIFIADNFLHIFEPQKADDGFDDLNRPCEFIGGSWEVCGVDHELINIQPNGEVKISRRQGKAFFWPEVSDDQ